MECNFCKAIVGTKHYLAKHQKTAKKCLKIQAEQSKQEVTPVIVPENEPVIVPENEPEIKTKIVSRYYLTKKVLPNEEETESNEPEHVVEEISEPDLTHYTTEIDIIKYVRENIPDVKLLNHMEEYIREHNITKITLYR